MSLNTDRCTVCNVNTDEDHLHTNSPLHRFNFLLFEWNKYRRSLVKDRNGIQIAQVSTGGIKLENCEYHVNKGAYIIKVSSKDYEDLSNSITCKFTIKSVFKNKNILLTKATILHPYEAFSISDKQSIVENNEVLLFEPGDEYNIYVNFRLVQTINGSFKIPVSFLFQTQSKTVESFTVAREVVIIICDHDEVEIDENKSPFTVGVWQNIQRVVPPTEIQFVSHSYPMPDEYSNVLKTGLQDNKYLTSDDHFALNYIRNVLDPDYKFTGYFQSKSPTPENYKDFFHIVIWLDECAQTLMLEKYNMSNVTMKVIKDGILELEVPGLAEKRPSLITGDIIKIRFHEDHTVYKGVVSCINDKTIEINKVDYELVTIVEDNPSIELDVAYELGRLPYERKHRGIDLCVGQGMLSTLFPVTGDVIRCVDNSYRLADSNFFNQSLLSNREQKLAVLNILNCTSQHAPYIVFGPPGTGKTITIVEAILQIKANVSSSHILVCAPANAACDMLTEKLLHFCTKKELIRVHTETRDWKTVPANIKPYSNWESDKYKKLNGKDLSTYRIVVTTLVLIGKFAGYYHPDYVFIDEAAQAMEPEVCVAVGLMSPGKQLILAGDPKQLGPQCASKVSEKLSLGTSLLERLMNTNELYRNGNSNFITMLKLNYRSHPKILQIPNEQFYESQLQAVNSKPYNDPIANTFIYPKTLARAMKGRKNVSEGPVEFCAVIAKEKRQGKSPSYFNESEIQMVLKYVKALLALTHTTVEQTDIGIVTPYIRQVHRLKGRLVTLNLADIEIGTTETFQGREKRIMIVTTVRSQHSLLLVDEKYKLGFVSNEKRFNVALTRAKSKLIVIGNPFVLGTSKNWLRFIEFCEEQSAYFGPQYLRRTQNVRNEIISRFESVHYGNGRGSSSANNNNNTKHSNRRNRHN